ncbi:TRL domain-containing protein [Pseudomonadota bacterium]
MKKIITLTFLLLLGACSIQRTPYSSRWIDVRDYDIGNVSFLKEGKACENYLFWIPLPGKNSSSVVKAMEDARISKLKMIDDKKFITGIWNQRCTIVYGE